ncbi:MAG: DUF1638 domain-containing protein [Clostridiales Family XIII bacterium]|jgi:hypothetical protein|nr:DUF1638 domain-containing protein [Clostridiales Family XIII bacterium]
MLNLKIIACKSMYRELSLLAALSTNVTDVTWLRQGLHDTPEKLAQTLQAEVAAIDAETDMHTNPPPYGDGFDAILIGYGLCCNGIVGLSSEKTPIVIPRAHDCMTFFLGSKERYKQEFSGVDASGAEKAANGGTYWFSPGWIECCTMPSAASHEYRVKLLTPKYGAERAEKMVDQWEEYYAGYSRLAYIKWPEFEGLPFETRAVEFSKEAAVRTGWTYEELPGDPSLLRDFLEGNWDEERFLVVPPGKKVAASFDDDIIEVE